MKASCFVYTFLSFFYTSLCYSQAGNLDPDFGGGDGLVTTSFFNEQPCQGYSVALQEDGRILVAGVTRATGGLEHSTLTRYLPDGTLDNSFNGTGMIIISSGDESSYGRVVTVQPDGKILLAIRYNTDEGQGIALYRYLTDGSPDAGFDTDGIRTISFGSEYLSVDGMVLQEDDKIVIGGYMSFAIDTFDLYYVARYLPDGTADDSFDGDGIVTKRVGENYGYITSLLIQPDNKIIAAGYGVFNQNDDFAVVRFNSDGSVDESFGDSGIAHATLSTGEDICTGAALQPDGKIVLGGNAFSNITGTSAFAAARFNADGTLDHNFHGDGMTILTVSGHADGVRTILRQPDGKILLGGYAHSNVQGGSDMVLVRLNENGIPDFTFSDDGVAIYEDGLSISSEVHEMTLQPDGKIVSTGFERTGGINSIRVARFISGLTVGTTQPYKPEVNISIYPNPISDYAILSYQLDEFAMITVHLCDMQGRIIEELMPAAEKYPGYHHESLSLRNRLPPGSYVVKLESENWFKTLKVMVD